MLRILILNYEYPPIGGGAGIVTKHLAEEFIKLGHQITILTTWFEGETENYKHNNYEIIRLKSKRKSTFQSNPFEMYDWIKKSKQYFNKNNIQGKFDVCLANFTLPGGEVALFLKQKFNLPYIILSHGHDIPWAFPKQMLLWHTLSYFWIKKICTQSAYNIILSDELKTMADNLVPSNKSKNIIINNGLQIQDFNKQFSGDILKIIFIGRLVEQKNPMLFLESINHLKDLNIPYQVAIYGDGDLRKNMELYVQKNKLEQIYFKGKVNHNDVMNALKNADILISSSKSEGMALAILEALSFGVYVVATNTSGNNKLVIEHVNGNIVKEANASIITTKITDFYHQKFTKNYTYPIDYIKQLQAQFSWQGIAKQYIDLLTKAANKN